MIHNVPSGALISQPKVEFPEMAHRILLTNCAKATLKPILGHLQKTMICQTKLEASWKFRALDLGVLETTKESFQGNFTLENPGNPLAGEFCTTTRLA